MKKLCLVIVLTFIGCGVKPPSQPLSVPPKQAFAMSINVPASATIQKSGGTPPYSFTVIAGAMPAGLVMDTSTGVITGTPLTKGVYNFSVMVKDSSK